MVVFKEGLKPVLFKPKNCMQIGIWVNLVLTGFKLFAGIVGLSKAMIADALHSFSDILATSVAYVGIVIGARPADEDHPYGHGNAETIAAALISLIILAIGAYIGISASLAIIHRQFQKPLTIALVAAIVSIVTKELLYRYTIKVGKISNSPAIIADAWHHRSDAYSSIGTLIGIGGAKFAFLYLDPLAALVVSGFIFKIAFWLIRENVGIMMDEQPQQAFIHKIRMMAQDTPGVKRIDSLKVHRRGSNSTIDIEIAVDSQITVDEGHKVSTNVRGRLLKKIANIREVMVHVNPFK